MTNSMSKAVEVLKSFNPLVEEIDDREIKISLSNDKVISALDVLKSMGFSHLSLITCVDWIDDNQFELVYILFNWEDGGKVLVSTRIDRSNPKFVTVKELWPVARFYERELHEFFGVEFEGNDDMRPLFLELWDEKPPMRKDFDPSKYSKEKFPDRKYEKDVIKEAKIFRGEING
ncbi:MAG: NADH-quinone oxidoreductase subunit C [Thermotogaceae bacterium]|nr:NADH-quinone oxidoreductase subunit C [Thermotogaceae bacterium]